MIEGLAAQSDAKVQRFVRRSSKPAEANDCRRIQSDLTCLRASFASRTTFSISLLTEEKAVLLFATTLLISALTPQFIHALMIPRR